MFDLKTLKDKADFLEKDGELVVSVKKSLSDEEADYLFDWAEKRNLSVNMSIANPTQDDLAFSQDVKNILKEINETPSSERKPISQKTLDRWQDEAQGTVIHGSIEEKEITQGVGEVLFSKE